MTFTETLIQIQDHWMNIHAIDRRITRLKQQLEQESPTSPLRQELEKELNGADTLLSYEFRDCGRVRAPMEKILNDAVEAALEGFPDKFLELAKDFEQNAETLKAYAASHA